MVNNFIDTNQLSVFCPHFPHKLKYQFLLLHIKTHHQSSESGDQASNKYTFIYTLYTNMTTALNYLHTHSNDKCDHILENQF